MSFSFSVDVLNHDPDIGFALPDQYTPVARTICDIKIMMRTTSAPKGYLKFYFRGGNMLKG